jgi:hypothetical protein
MEGRSFKNSGVGLENAKIQDAPIVFGARLIAIWELC